MSKYQTLEVWKTTMELVKETYLLTKKYPKDELYTLTSQTRRAAVSVPANIAEGRVGNIKRIQFSFFIFQEGRYMNWKHI